MNNVFKFHSKLDSSSTKYSKIDMEYSLNFQIFFSFTKNPKILETSIFFVYMF